MNVKELKNILKDIPNDYVICTHDIDFGEVKVYNNDITKDTEHKRIVIGNYSSCYERRCIDY